MPDGPGTTPRGGDDGGPPRAVVVPRAGRAGSDASLPLHCLIGPIIAARGRGLILVTGRSGSGKTTALLHLRATLPPGTAPLFDEADDAAAARAAAEGWAVLFAFGPPIRTEPVVTFALRPWTSDDCLEYLIVRHRPACASVLRRLTVDPSVESLGGSPQLLAAVMDAMAADESVATAADALRRHAWRTIPPGPALDRLMVEGPLPGLLAGDLARWWRHVAYQHVCTADWIAARLAAGAVPPQVADVVADGRLMPEIAAAVRLRPAAVDHLRRIVADDPRSKATPMAASVLLAIDPAWRPADGRGLNLARARLAGARWAGLDLTGAVLTGADLSAADLAAATLARVDAGSANLTGAHLHAARLTGAKLAGATLQLGDLSDAFLDGVDLTDADLTGVDLRGADCSGSTFVGTALVAARAVGANCSAATFDRVDWRDADLSAAAFTRATLRRLDLTTATWTGACFGTASLIGCHLEGLDLPRADFHRADLTGSLLTGSHLPDADLRHAKLCRTGLADVDWTGADLRGADLTGASFHLGSTRSGLVGSAVPMEGSMTGFYTDDYPDQSFRPPEEIRKACLCGANLLGAVVERTDFYLVDLRRATYTPDQRAHFARTGAILG